MVNQAQRLDGLEAEVAGIKEQVEAFQNTFAQQLATAMQNAIPTLQQSFAEQFARSLEALNSKQNDELAALSIQLEGRIDRSRENQEMAIAVMRNEQANFQTEIRAVATELRAIKRNPHHALNHRKRVIIIGVALPSDASGLMCRPRRIGERGKAARVATVMMPVITTMEGRGSIRNWISLHLTGIIQMGGSFVLRGIFDFTG